MAAPALNQHGNFPLPYDTVDRMARSLKSEINNQPTLTIPIAGPTLSSVFMFQTMGELE